MRRMRGVGRGGEVGSCTLSGIEQMLGPVFLKTGYV